MRSGRSNPGNTGFFLDSVEIPTLFHLALGPSVIHPYFFGGLDFFPGGYPARFGRYVGGIVTAETRAPPADQAHASVDVRLFDAGGDGLRAHRRRGALPWRRATPTRASS